MNNKVVSVTVALGPTPIPKEAEYYFIYRYSEVTITPLKDSVAEISFKVSGELCPELKAGLVGVIEHNMSLFGLNCHDWNFEAINQASI
ncbi:hypothetical protein [Hahella sp. HN01]|uniref:hypothetical protein n=1 Tax=Hahella sp. HN01 TaxID=2847262 RepID=UPI001C1EFBE7|nr:hypothetical protein [Hahella sp. HN01]MBU6955984.1 hypothetical protein [Hahella sp. HN01]